MYRRLVDRRAIGFDRWTLRVAPEGAGASRLALSNRRGLDNASRPALCDAAL